MAAPCRNLERFADGELDAADADAFRDHLLGCGQCKAQLAELLQLRALSVRHHQRQPPQLVTLPRAQVRPQVSLRRVLAGGALSFAAAAALTLVLLEKASVPDALWMPAKSVRLIEGRSSYPRASQHLPMREGTLGPAHAVELLPHALMARLPSGEGGAFALAASYLVRGQPALADAALEVLQPLGSSADLQCERALAYLVRGSADYFDYEAALRLSGEALELDPRHGPALWNRALALRGLGLDMLAARTFEECAKLAEPGWSQEAWGKASQLRGSAVAARDRWREVTRAGGQLVATGTLPRRTLVDAPILRSYLYEAALSRPSARDVEALLPLARDLDALAGGAVLEDYVRAVARRDFSTRAPLAHRYLELATQPGAARDARLVAELLRSTEDDILIGTSMKVQAPPGGERERAAFHGALISADPWFHALSLQREAAAAQEAGDLTGARRALEEALVICQQPGLEFRCVDVELSLGELLLRAADLDEAYAHASRGLDLARRVGEWGKQVQLLGLLGQLARVREDVPVARAYLEETLELSQRDEVERFAHGNLALVELSRLHVDAARQQIDLALGTGLPLTPIGAAALADLARLRPSPGDEAAMETFRAGVPEMRLGHRALATHIVGRFVIERDPAEGRQLLEDAIAQVRALATPGEEGARALSYSYTSLMLADGRDGDFASAWARFEQEAGRALPERCMVAAAVDVERTLVLVRSAAGGLDGAYDASRRSPLGASAEGLVPARLLSELRGCEEVRVLARAPLYGREGLLPRDIAWSYVLPRAPVKAAAAEPGGGGSHLIVQDVALSDRRRHLGTIWSWGPGEERGGDERILSGAAATPRAVARQLEDAASADLVAHGLMDPASAEPYLVLAADRDGDALRASRIERLVLRHQPIVVLASCGAARPSPQIESPRSLPAAFLRAGARAVLAAASDIPEREGPAFFNAVRRRIDGGSTPARALREERESWIAQSRGRSWLDSVLLFE